MQGLADGYFVLPYTIGNYLADEIRTGKISTSTPEFDAAEKNVREQIQTLMNNGGTLPVDHFHKKLGKVMWNKCGMGRNEKGLREAIEEIRQIRTAFYKNVRVPGTADYMNQELEKALRVADFIELGELMCIDALERKESCGGHFREEYQTEDGEALRDDENFKYVAAWEWTGNPSAPELNKEELIYENIKVQQRSYK
jgi:succinate dehydrogenase / fumarate reductase flavoprotein subunit